MAKRKRKLTPEEQELREATQAFYASKQALKKRTKRAANVVPYVPSYEQLGFPEKAPSDLQEIRRLTEEMSNVRRADLLLASENRQHEIEEESDQAYREAADRGAEYERRMEFANDVVNRVRNEIDLHDVDVYYSVSGGFGRPTSPNFREHKKELQSEMRSQFEWYVNKVGTIVMAAVLIQNEQAIIDAIDHTLWDSGGKSFADEERNKSFFLQLLEQSLSALDNE